MRPANEGANKTGEKMGASKERLAINYLLGYLDGMAATLTLCREAGADMVADINDMTEGVRDWLDQEAEGDSPANEEQPRTSWGGLRDEIAAREEIMSA